MKFFFYLSGLLFVLSIVALVVFGYIGIFTHNSTYGHAAAFTLVPIAVFGVAAGFTADEETSNGS
jgi:hypothetical protein